ncbi:hypothetical protein [Flaviaesturariibacter amylovorans]
MKRALFSSALVALLFSACSKSDAVAEMAPAPENAQNQQPAGNTVETTQNGSWVTGWENPSTWSKTAGNDNVSIFNTPRNFKQLDQTMLNRGAIMVFARGYNFADVNMNTPLGVPFHFYLPYERMNFPVFWRYVAKMYGIDLNLEMHNDQSKYFIGAQPNVQLRYFLVPPEALARMNMTADDLRQMSYTNLVNLLQVAP